MKPTKFFAVSVVPLAIVLMAGCGDSDKAGLTHISGKESVAGTTKAVDGAVAQKATRSFVLTASSQSADLGPQGLFSAVPPGWHSSQPPKFPETVTVDFGDSRQLRYLGLLQQEGQPERAPKALRVEMSNDGNTWVPVAGADDACKANMPDGWFNIDFSRPSSGRYLRVVIFTNCGDAYLLTVRGLRVG